MKCKNVYSVLPALESKFKFKTTNIITNNDTIL